VRGATHDAVKGSSRLTSSPSARSGANSICWLIWHLTRIQERPRRRRRRPRAALDRGWMDDRFGLPFPPARHRVRARPGRSGRGAGGVRGRSCSGTTTRCTRRRFVTSRDSGPTTSIASSTNGGIRRCRSACDSSACSPTTCSTSGRPPTSGASPGSERQSRASGSGRQVAGVRVVGGASWNTGWSGAMRRSSSSDESALTPPKNTPTSAFHRLR